MSQPPDASGPEEVLVRATPALIKELEAEIQEAQESFEHAVTDNFDELPQKVKEALKALALAKARLLTAREFGFVRQQ
jgi:hypothetical protein